MDINLFIHVTEEFRKDHNKSGADPITFNHFCNIVLRYKNAIAEQEQQKLDIEDEAYEAAFNPLS